MFQFLTTIAVSKWYAFAIVLSAAFLPCWVDCAAIGVIGVDVLLASHQTQHCGVVQPWRRGCPPSRGPLGTCSSPCGKVRTSPFAAADSTATHRQSWRSHSPQNRRHLRVSGGSSTNARSQPNLIPRGQPSRWRLLVTKGGRSSYSRSLAVSPWIGFLNGTKGNRST